MEKFLFTSLIEEQSPTEPFYQIYWAWASDPGQAIQNMLNSTKANGLGNPFARQLDNYDINQLEAEVEPNSASDIFWSTSRVHFPPEQSFKIPVGVIPSSSDKNGNDPDDIVSGHTIECNEDGLIKIMVNVESDLLLPVYSQLLELNEFYKVFWYVLHPDSDDKDNLFLINEQFNTPHRIINHLQENYLDSIQNGLVTLTSYFEEGATNLNICDHKRIIAITYSKALANNYSNFLKSLHGKTATAHSRLAVPEWIRSSIILPGRKNTIERLRSKKGCLNFFRNIMLNTTNDTFGIDYAALTGRLMFV
ncbi:MAG: hypothetical protein ABFR90_07355 [Planctomycetota bacterium]